MHIKSIFPIKLLVIVTVFSIAMGFLESVVVVYIREILYPGGFEFPLKPFELHLAITEIIREVATLIMLISIGILSGRTITEKFAWFLYSFAIWDIFYYVFLKMLINWPESFLTWDILFLIPVTWVGPVMSPLIIAITMIILSLVLVYYNRKDGHRKIIQREWIIFFSGSLVLILAWTWDYSGYILEHYHFAEIFTVPKDDLFSVAAGYIPRKFNWGLFWIGEGIIFIGITLIFLRLRKKGIFEI